MTIEYAYTLLIEIVAVARARSRYLAMPFGKVTSLKIFLVGL